MRAERARAVSDWEIHRARGSAAERVAALTEEAFARGVATEVELAQAQLDVVEAEVAALEALIDYLSADLMNRR